MITCKYCGVMTNDNEHERTCHSMPRTCETCVWWGNLTGCHNDIVTSFIKHNVNSIVEIEWFDTPGDFGCVPYWQAK